MRLIKYFILSTLISSPALAGGGAIFQPVDSQACVEIGLNYSAYLFKDKTEANLIYALPKFMHARATAIKEKEIRVAYLHRASGPDFIEVILSPNTALLEETIAAGHTCLTDAGVQLDWLKSQCTLGQITLNSLPKQLYSRIEIDKLDEANETYLLRPIVVRVFTKYPNLLIRSVLLNGIKGNIAVSCNVFLTPEAETPSAVTHGIEINAKFDQVRGA